MYGTKTYQPPIECIERDCRRSPVEGAPLPLCGKYIRQVYEFACDCIEQATGSVDSRLVDAEKIQAQAVLDGFREIRLNHARARQELEEYEAQELLRTVDVEAGVSVVYYLRFGDRVKIGTTTNLAKRRQAVPHDELLATEPGGRQTEHARHLQFADQRITGEWFTYVDPLRGHITELANRNMATNPA